jgi:carbon storage regulator
MLVLTRKINEKIRLGSDIIISIVSTSENQVKIGIEAPANFKILREELYQKLKESNLDALNQSKDTKLSSLSKLKINKINKKTK